MLFLLLLGTTNRPRKKYSLYFNDKDYSFVNTYDKPLIYASIIVRNVYASMFYFKQWHLPNYLRTLGLLR